MTPILIVSSGSSEVVYYELVPGPNVIGRDRSCQLRLWSEGTSRSHCTIFWMNDAWWLEDHSTNGTAVNGVVVKRGEMHLLRHGDIIRVDNMRIELRTRDTSIRGGSTRAFPLAEQPDVRSTPAVSSEAPTSLSLPVFDGGRVIDFHGLIGRSAPMLALYDKIQKVAPLPDGVLVRGETGTGKELVAHAIHVLSGREGQFVRVNCATLDPSLFESSIHGHERGSFTGAVRRQEGLFESAQDGTLMLDEVGELSKDVQARLLRVLENKETRRLGGTTTRELDVRILACTHRDLDAMVRSREFREDLLQRLDEQDVRLPPLRERRDDIPQLARVILARRAEQPPRWITGEAVAVLVHHDWPGNVRELQNKLGKASIHATDGILQVPHFLEEEWGRAALREALRTDPSSLGAFIDSMSGRELAAVAGISRTTLQGYLKKRR